MKQKYGILTPKVMLNNDRLRLQFELLTIFYTLPHVRAFKFLRKLPIEARGGLSRKGYFAQDGYILKYFLVSTNCLSVLDVSDGDSACPQ